jgi:hypothetical protein
MVFKNKTCLPLGMKGYIVTEGIQEEFLGYSLYLGEGYMGILTL